MSRPERVRSERSQASAGVRRPGVRGWLRGPDGAKDVPGGRVGAGRRKVPWAVLDNHELSRIKVPFRKREVTKLRGATVEVLGATPRGGQTGTAPGRTVGEASTVAVLVDRMRREDAALVDCARVVGRRAGPDPPWGNGHVENPRSKPRDELLNHETFHSLQEAETLIEG